MTIDVVDAAAVAARGLVAGENAVGQRNRAVAVKNGVIGTATACCGITSDSAACQQNWSITVGERVAVTVDAAAESDAILPVIVQS